MAIGIEKGDARHRNLVVVAARERAKDERLRRLVDALERATIWLINHPEEGWRTFAAAHPDLDDELNRRAWRDTRARFARRPAARDRARYERFAAFLKGRGLIKEIPPLASYATELP